MAFKTSGNDTNTRAHCEKVDAPSVKGKGIKQSLVSIDCDINSPVREEGVHQAEDLIRCCISMSLFEKKLECDY